MQFVSEINHVGVFVFANMPGPPLN